MSLEVILAEIRLLSMKHDELNMKIDRLTALQRMDSEIIRKSANSINVVVRLLAGRTDMNMDTLYDILLQADANTGTVPPMDLSFDQVLLNNYPVNNLKLLLMDLLKILNPCKQEENITSVNINPINIPYTSSDNVPQYISHVPNTTISLNQSSSGLTDRQTDISHGPNTTISLNQSFSGLTDRPMSENRHGNLMTTPVNSVQTSTDVVCSQEELAKLRIKYKNKYRYLERYQPSCSTQGIQNNSQQSSSTQCGQNNGQQSNSKQHGQNNDQQSSSAQDRQKNDLNSIQIRLNNCQPSSSSQNGLNNCQPFSSSQNEINNEEDGLPPNFYYEYEKVHKCQKNVNRKIYKSDDHYAIVIMPENSDINTSRFETIIRPCSDFDAKIYLDKIDTFVPPNCPLDSSSNSPNISTANNTIEPSNRKLRGDKKTLRKRRNIIRNTNVKDSISKRISIPKKLPKKVIKNKRKSKITK